MQSENYSVPSIAARLPMKSDLLPEFSLLLWRQSPLRGRAGLMDSALRHHGLAYIASALLNLRR
jgi:hypothetical protein